MEVQITVPMLHSLHGLHQVIFPTSHPELDPFVALTQLRRRPSPKGKEKQGDVEWVVCVGAVGEGSQDRWWAAALTLQEVEALIDIPGAAIRGEEMVKRMREAFVDGQLDVRGYNSTKVGALELVFQITPSLAVPIPVLPSLSAPLSLVSILTPIIPKSLLADCTLAKETSASAALAALQKSHDKLAVENKRNKDFIKQAKANVGRSASQGPSPKKEGPVVPGVTHRAQLKPGQPGFSGNARRAGVVAQRADEFDEVSD